MTAEATSKRPVRPSLLLWLLLLVLSMVDVVGRLLSMPTNGETSQPAAVAATLAIPAITGVHVAPAGTLDDDKSTVVRNDQCWAVSNWTKAFLATNKNTIQHWDIRLGKSLIGCCCSNVAHHRSTTAVMDIETA